jgi:fumarylpyruvate hydrolase
MQAIPVLPQASVAIAQSSDRFPVRRVFCVGRNYADHAKEMGASGREPPFFFIKPADAIFLVNANETRDWPYPTLTADLHHEVELVVAIGKGGKDIAVDAAAGHIWGYAVGLDMTRRDLQAVMKKESKPWCIGKAFEHAAPIGVLTPIEKTGEITGGAITLQVNGQAAQSGDIGDMIWNVREVIAHISRAWELKPGDLIYTGTPAGVGAVRRGDVLRAHAASLEPFSIRII